MKRRNFTSTFGIALVGVATPLTAFAHQQSTLTAAENTLLAAATKLICWQGAAGKLSPAQIQQTLLYPKQLLKASKNHQLVFLNKAGQRISISKQKGDIKLTIQH